MSDGLSFILCFENVATSKALSRWLVDSGVSESQIAIENRNDGLRCCLTSTSANADYVVLTDISFEPDSHLVSLPSEAGIPPNPEARTFFMSACHQGHFLCFVWDDRQSYYDLAERLPLAKEWRTHSLALPVALRCPARVRDVFWVGSTRGELERFEAVVLGLNSTAPSFSCTNSCFVGKDPIDEMPYTNWDVLVLDDQVLKAKVNPSKEELRGLCKLGEPARKFREAVEALQPCFHGDWYIGGTEVACTLLCLDKQHPLYPDSESDSFPRLRDPIYGFENYDAILLDVLFDLKCATDIHFVPKATKLSGTPVFMFSSAGTEGAHNESALYYANRALRLGAVGFLDKSEVVGRLLQTVETIRRTTGWKEWKREWEERFQRSAGSFLGGNNDLLLKLFEESAEESPADHRSADSCVDGNSGRLVKLLKELADKGAADRVQSKKILPEEEKDEAKEILKRYCYILCKLFEDCERIEYDGTPDAGLGAGTKFFVVPIRHGRRDNSKFVKIGLYDDLQFEEKSFKDCIAGYLDTFTGQISRPMVRADRYAGIVYSFVGYSADSKGRCKDVRDLKNLVLESVEQQYSTEQVHRILEELDHAFFSRLYRERAVITKAITGVRQYPEHRLGSQHSAERFVRDICGIETAAQWWCKEYLDLLPPIYEYCIKNALPVRAVPALQRTQKCVGKVNNNLTGRLESIEWEKPDGESLNVNMYLIDPFRHQRIRVKFSGEDQSKELLLRHGKWLSVPYTATNIKSLSMWDELKERLDETLANIIAGKNDDPKGRTVSEVYRPLLSSLRSVSINDALGTKDWESLRILEEICQSMGYLEDINSSVDFDYIPMTVTTVHGDLNLGNVMVGSAGDKVESRNYWLIDFEKTHLYGHLAQDFAKLETDIRHYVIPKVLMDSMQLGYIREAGNATAKRELRSALALQMAMERSLWDGTPLIGISEPLRTAYEWISGLRELATKRYGVSQYELKISVFLHCMSSIKYKKGYGDPKKESFGYFPRLVYYVAADALRDDIRLIISNARKRREEDYG